MAELPSASVVIDDEAGAFGGSLGYCAVFSCAALNADAKPRVFAGAKGLLTTHGYSPGASYVASHIEKTRKPVLFLALPIATPGTIGRQNSTGVVGSSAISVAAGANGVLEELDGIIEILEGGTVGTIGIRGRYSLDGGHSWKTFRLGTATSLTPPHVGVVFNFGAGDLEDGDRYTFTTTAPMWDSAGLQSAREQLAAQQKPARSWQVCGDVSNATEAGYVLTEANAYETANERFNCARVTVRDRLPLAEMSKITKRMTGSPNITFAEVGGTGDTITRSSGSFVADGFAVGDVITVAGALASAGANNVTGRIASLSATVITLDTTDLVAEGPIAGVTITASPSLTFAEVGGTGDTITRSSGSWLADGFRVGDTVTITGTSGNNVSGPITALTATVLTFGATDLAAEEIRSDAVTITKGETMAQWMSAMDSAMDSIDDAPRIDIAAGRARRKCPITQWLFRRPAQWHVSIREYEHDVHIPTWRKDDGPLDGVSLEDLEGNVVEYNELTDGGALAARFTCLRTYANGPNGAFVALDLTRAQEGSLLSRYHNMAVANVACAVTHAATENAIGQVLELDDEGRPTPDSLGVIRQRVEAENRIALLQDKGEGKRASNVTWEPDGSIALNVVGAELPGVLFLTLNGTLEKISTRVRIPQAGA